MSDITGSESGNGGSDQEGDGKDRLHFKEESNKGRRAKKPNAVRKKGSKSVGRKAKMNNKLANSNMDLPNVVEKVQKHSSVVV